MIVWITHVKVGHRQILTNKKPSGENLGVFYLIEYCGDDLLERSDNTRRGRLLRRTLTCAACYVGGKVGHRQILTK